MLTLKAPSREMRLEMNNALKVMVEEVEYFSKKFPTEANVTLWKNVEQRIAEVYVTAPGSTKKEDIVTTVTRSVNTSEVIQEISKSSVRQAGQTMMLFSS